MNANDALYRMASVLTHHLLGPERRERTKREIWTVAHRTIADFMVQSGCCRPLDVGTGAEAGLARSLVECAVQMKRPMYVTTIDNQRRNVLAAERHPAIRFLFGDATEPLAFEAHSFDGLSSSFCLEYIDEERLRAALLEFRRVLLPGSPVCFALYCGSKLGCIFDKKARPQAFGSWSLKPPSLVTESLRVTGFRNIEKMFCQTGADEVFSNLQEIAIISARSAK